MRREHVIEALRQAPALGRRANLSRIGAALDDAERMVTYWLEDHPDDVDIAAGREILAELRREFDDLRQPA
jgi:hypothetical protein